MTDRLWKVTVSCLFPMGKPIEMVFEVHHATEEGARRGAETGSDRTWWVIDSHGLKSRGNRVVLPLRIGADRRRG